MKILLIGIQNSGARHGYSGLFHPSGLAYISAALKKNGYSFDCLDLHNEEILSGGQINSWEKVESCNISEYDVVAFGGVFLKFNILKLLSAKIRNVKNGIFQIVGGNIATIISDIILKETRVDCVCLYEGEEVIIDLLERLQNGTNWKNSRSIKYVNEKNEIVENPSRGRIKDLDSIPFADRENWSFDVVRKAFPYGSPGRYSAVMFASRGCPFTCVFCSPISGNKIRSRSARNITEEIKYLKKHWNIQYIRFFDENFIGSKEKIRELCNLMIKEDLNIFWWCQTQIKLIDEETLKIMKRAGCIEIAYGIESGSNKILDEMRKGITKEEAMEIVIMTDRVGIKPSLNLISGMPSENYETLKETRDFIKSLNRIAWTQVPTIDFIVPFPNTELYRIAKRRALIKDEKKYLTEELFELGRYTRTINLTRMKDNDFINFLNQCNKEIRTDYYSKHPFRKILSVFGLDHLRLELIFKKFSLKSINPIIESLLWATLGKRNSRIGRFINGIIYRKTGIVLGKQGKNKADTYWKTFLGIPRYKIEWYFKYYLYKIFGFTFDKLKEQRNYWSARGRQYYRDFFDSECYKYEIFFQDLLIEELKNLDFSSIFEAGCGFGWNVKRIKKEMPHIRTGGIDFSFPQLDNSRIYQKNTHIAVTQADACHMPFKSGAFDVGFSMGVFMNIHPGKINQAIDELLRVSRKYIIHLEWDQDNTTLELRDKRIFKTNIVSHDYKKLYKERGKNIIKFQTYKDFDAKFQERFKDGTKVKSWEQFEGPQKYILIIVET